MRALTPADVPKAAEVIADAFADDPFWAWLFPGADRRLVVRSWIRQLEIAYLPKGHSYTDADVRGAALWAPPGRWRLSLSQELRLAPSYLRLLGPRRMRLASRAFSVIEGGHPDEPHWYLSVLGVSPSHQRSGIGRSLLEPMLERADREGVAASLETFKMLNVPYYESLGFRVTKEDDIPDGGPHMWAMVRRPRLRS
jgi:ribosomal protein S18 acetylase RimI-like enzyme